MFEELIGYQLIDLSDYGFTVKKGDDVRHFKFDKDHGDCGGYSSLKTKLFIDNNETQNNPIVTNIEDDDVNCWNYGKHGNCWDYGEHRIITFSGGEKKLAEIESESGSGSGWYYGACVTVHCLETDEIQAITAW